MEKRRKWHTHWLVDLTACTATHDSGLVVKFAKAEVDPSTLDGKPVNTDEWLAKIKDTMPPDDLASHTSRLFREAGDAYLYQLKWRH